jgi:hypothetical protein
LSNRQSCDPTLQLKKPFTGCGQEG